MSGRVIHTGDRKRVSARPWGRGLVNNSSRGIASDFQGFNGCDRRSIPNDLNLLQFDGCRIRLRGSRWSICAVGLRNKCGGSGQKQKQYEEPSRHNHVSPRRARRTATRLDGRVLERIPGIRRLPASRRCRGGFMLDFIFGSEKSPDSGFLLEATLKTIEKKYILFALTGGLNRTLAAAIL
jgi:hypothetical protein